MSSRWYSDGFTVTVDNPGYGQVVVAADPGVWRCQLTGAEVGAFLTALTTRALTTRALTVETVPVGTVPVGTVPVGTAPVGTSGVGDGSGSVGTLDAEDGAGLVLPSFMTVAVARGLLLSVQQAVGLFSPR